MYEHSFIDSHAHIYLPQFKSDIDLIIKNALDIGIKKILLPNIDIASINPMLQLCQRYPEQCFPMIALHPTSVKKNYPQELLNIENHLRQQSFIAIGETGIDLYWDKTYSNEQLYSFKKHIEWALQYNLPLVIHARNSFNEIFSVLDTYKNTTLTGVFHSFTGNLHQAQKALMYNFYIGLNGIITYKNSGLGEVIKKIPLEKMILETDAPFLPPHPHRGKRNEPAYLIHIAQKIAELKNIDLTQIAETTSKNAIKLFNLT